MAWGARRGLKKQDPAQRPPAGVIAHRQQRMMPEPLEIRLGQLLVRVREGDRRIQPDARHSRQHPVGQAHPGQRPVPRDDLRPGGPAGLIHRRDDPPVRAGAGAGGAAYLLGPAHKALAVINCTYSYVTDTPDFWRRAYQKYPEHGQRFTGEPAYFRHVSEAAKALMDATGASAADYQYAIFHQPNTKFPQRVAAQLGFSKEQIAPGLLVPVIGNTYAGAAMIGLTATLDVARPGDNILVVSFGSGAGSDAFSITVTEAIEARRHLAPCTTDYIARRIEIDYAIYARLRGKLVMK